MAEELLTKRIEDMADVAIKSDKVIFGDFYEERIRMLIEREITRYKDVSCAFWGAQDYAQRQMLCVYPTGHEPNLTQYPLSAIWIQAKHALVHPQVMGALLGLGIEVSKVGDISILSDKVQIVVSSPLKDFVLQNLLSVDKYDVELEEVSIKDVVETVPELKEISAVVPSLRVDCIVGECFNLSRSAALAFVKSEKVRVNHETIKKPAATLKEGDLVSVASKGRFIFSSVEGTTKKGNIKIHLKKFV